MFSVGGEEERNRWPGATLFKWRRAPIWVEESYKPLSTITYFGMARTLQYRSLKMHAYLGDWIHSTVHCKLLAADKECEWSTKEEEAHFSHSARLQTEIVSHRFKPLPQLTNYRAMFLFFHCRFAFGRPLLEYKVPFVWTFPGKRKNPSWPVQENKGYYKSHSRKWPLLWQP